ncbi:CHAP domain-containing protein [Aeriscardovia aeriphila]|uniref:Amidase n=1 Tax=Aeriscardovia aeriphila TaxID=218139 RepID=A0A261FBB1_9BIFI|nr:CHAP domain-containing protein [Aeriscardovia aeriphila]NYI25434.1 surface antigen [Aeriscardovia aeriphila]OZG56412.1 amidase [Aeriscardovia aeriphila]
MRRTSQQEPQNCDNSPYEVRWNSLDSRSYKNATVLVNRQAVSRKLQAALVAVVAMASLGTALVATQSNVPNAHAVTYSQLQSARARADAARARSNELRNQLAGVSAALRDKIVALDDLNNNQIPAAQDALDQATQAAQTAQAAADAAKQRMEAAQKDQADLKAKIAQTGKNYDDARAALAQSARSAMHGSAASTTVAVVTQAKSTNQFVSSMQSKAAVDRAEANAANSSAEDLSLSQNREERLQAIADRIAQLKAEADAENARAQQAQADAQSKKQALDALVAKSTQERADLEAQQSQLTTASARQAAQAVALQSQLNATQNQYQAERAAAAAQAAQQASQSQGSYRAPANPPSPSHSGGSSSSNPGFSSGDSGNAYPWGQCTWWAYVRRHQLGLPVGSYFGDGAQWANSARAHGYRVDQTPSVGAVIVFAPGQDGADPVYGHVAIVEAVYGNRILISESNARGLGVISNRTLYAPGHWFIH